MSRRGVHVLALTATAVLAAGCGGGEHKPQVVARVAGTPIERESLDRAVEHAREQAMRRGSAPAEDSSDAPAFRRRVLDELVLQLELSKRARQLHVYVPEAGIYEVVEKQAEASGGEKKNGEGASSEEEAFARQQARAELLYQALYRKVTAGARVRPARVKAQYASQRAGFRRRGVSPARARLAIRTRLLDAERRRLMARWLARTKQAFAGKVEIARDV